MMEVCGPLDKMVMVRTNQRWAGYLLRQWDAVLFIVVLLVANCPLIWGGDTSAWAFYLDRVQSGEFWRVLSYPFGHVTWYHLLLDAGVFLPLYMGLEDRRKTHRLALVACAALGALLAGLLASSQLPSKGLRGLSGIAYGLMAIWAIEMMLHRDRGHTYRRLGFLFLCFVLANIAWELATGTHVLDFLLFDMVGTPILICHLGGVVGAVVAYVALRLSGRRTSAHIGVSMKTTLGVAASSQCKGIPDSRCDQRRSE